MGYEIVDTPAATYYVISDVHSHRTKQGVPENLPSVRFDSFIVEDISDQEGYQEPVPKRVEKKLDTLRNYTNRINLGDIPTRAAPVLLRAMTIAGTGIYILMTIHPLAGLAGVAAASSIAISGNRLGKAGEHTPSLRRLSRLVHYSGLFFYGKKALTYRNAVIAEKAEQFIAPTLRREIHQKPVIGILYGATHSGNIAQLLKDPYRRRKTLEKIPTRHRRPEMESLCTFTLTRDGWKIASNPHSIKLPAARKFTKRIHSRARLARMKMKQWMRRKG